MTTGKKKLAIFKGNRLRVRESIDKFLTEDPRWRVYIHDRALESYVHPSEKDVIHQRDTVRMLTDAQVRTALEACLYVAVDLISGDEEDELRRWSGLAIDIGAEIEVFDSQPGGVRWLEDARPVISFGEPYTPNPSLPKAVWLDVDGTSFTMFDKDGVAVRGPFEYHKVHMDAPLQHTIDIIKALQEDGYKIVVLSGREKSCEEATLKSFADVGIFPDDIFMRPVGSNIPDDVLKYSIFRESVEPKYDIHFAFDDRDKVVRMLRTVLKIPTFQVNYGAF